MREVYMFLHGTRLFTPLQALLGDFVKCYLLSVPLQGVIEVNLEQS